MFLLLGRVFGLVVLHDCCLLLSCSMLLVGSKTCWSLVGAGVGSWLFKGAELTGCVLLHHIFCRSGAGREGILTGFVPPV